MSKTWRASLWSKLVALGFIALIILGNIWFVQGIAQREAPIWLQILFSFTVVWLLLSGLGLGIHIWLLQSRDEEV